jgi:3-dehydroquinate synthase
MNTQSSMTSFVQSDPLSLEVANDDRSSYQHENGLGASITQRFTVEYQYPVYFTRDLFAVENNTLSDVVALDGNRTPKLFIVAEEGVLRHHQTLAGKIDRYIASHGMNLAGELLKTSGGEGIKQTPQTVDQVLQEIHLRGIDRHSYVIAIGGGAFLDTVGYAAAIAHRGVRLIRVPTTVLSQNDSGVGVKNAINAFGKKNFLGTFAPPYAVLNDLNLLDSLPLREWRSGIAEAVKVALIKDSDFFADLEQSATALIGRDAEAMQRLIVHCAKLHIDHIASGDPFERGSARPLDFGHWTAHKLEFLTDYRLLHGEAVAIGIALDVIYSKLAGYLKAESSDRILRVLSTLGFSLWAPELDQHLNDPSHPRSVLRGLEEFREHLGGNLTVTLLRDIGVGFEVHSMNMDLIRQAVAELQSYESSRIANHRGESNEARV